MNYLIQNAIKKSKLLSLFALIAIVGYSASYSQASKFAADVEPNPYCAIPSYVHPDPAYTPAETHTYNYMYAYCYRYWTKVTFTDVATSQVVAERISTRDKNRDGDNDYYANGSNPFYIHATNEGGFPTVNLSAGKQYRISTEQYYPGTGKTYYYYHNYYGTGYGRVFLDVNRDADFADNGEHLVTWTYGTSSAVTTNYREMYYTPTCTYPGKTRMRFMATYYYANYVYIYRIDPYYYYYDYNNISMRNACINGLYQLYDYMSYYGYDYLYDYVYGEVEDYLINITGAGGTPWPAANGVVMADVLYNTTPSKPMVTFQTTQTAGTTFKYRITGPAPSTDVQYEALSNINDPNSTTISVSGLSQWVAGAAANSGAKGAMSRTGGAVLFDKGGEYRVLTELSGLCGGTSVTRFTVARDFDMAAGAVYQPFTNVAPFFQKYPSNVTLPIEADFSNVGLQPVTSFIAHAEVIDPDGVVTWEDEQTWTGNLTSTQTTRIAFKVFSRSKIGVYKVRTWVEYAADQEAYNSEFPRSDAGYEYTFELAYDIQLKAMEITSPTQGETLVENRTFLPKVVFANEGISVASYFDVKMTITNLSTQDKVERSVNVADIPNGYGFNTREIKFPGVELAAGNYSICFESLHPDEQLTSDDKVCAEFTVIEGLKGTFTVGTSMTSSKHFNTIEDAMAALYSKGISGPITFELVDAQYNLTSPQPGSPAWDFTSRILNVGYNTKEQKIWDITWKAASNRATMRGGVNINLYTNSGVGIAFGQNASPVHADAIVKEFTEVRNINSDGYIKFDGGSQKSLKFNVYGTDDFGGHTSAFNLGSGSRNITVKNCLIENTTPSATTRVELPVTRFNANDLQFTFEPNRGDIFNPQGQLIGTVTYSAGIINRAGTGLRYGLSFPTPSWDTLSNKNNLIEGNEISKFGYGIVSIGIGVLRDQGAGQFKVYNNSDNSFVNNKIYDVTRGGIFVGNENNSMVKGNRIYNVNPTNINNIDAFGIYLGGNTKSGFKGYHTTSMKVDGNEISGVNSHIFARGIVSEQVQVTYGEDANQLKAPSSDERVQIVNNAVWGIEPKSATARVAGIHLLTERNTTDASGLTPSVSNYHSRNDLIANNTVMLTPMMATTGNVAGIGVQNAHKTRIMNNAVTISGNANSPEVAALIFLQSNVSSNNGPIVDRNAYWKGTGSIDIVRMVETRGNNELVSAGMKNEYQNIEQWQSWTGNDANSYYFDFTKDYELTGMSPMTLSIKLDNGQTPKGSKLNNTGERIGDYSSDFKGTSRGAAGQPYDIGAVEFTGRSYVTDLEILRVSEPSVYQSSIGTFNDAQYLMTEAPVSVKSTLRNNGSLQSNDVEITIKIYQETAVSGVWSSTPVIDKTVSADVSSNQNTTVDFGLATGGSGDFVPQTYYELGSSYVSSMPSHFVGMSMNVTPRYKIVVSNEADEQNGNNETEKIVRFYLKKSPLSMIVSSLELNANLSDALTPGTINAQVVAARVNHDKVTETLGNLGWYSSPLNGKQDYDVFNRAQWEPRNVNYAMYNNMIMTDGDDASGMLNRYQRDAIRNFLKNDLLWMKKNLVIASQEMLSMNSDDDFASTVLRAQYAGAASSTMTNAVGTSVHTLVGVSVGQNYPYTIDNAKNSNNQYIGYDYTNPNSPVVIAGLNQLYPKPIRMSAVDAGEGLAKVAANYTSTSMNPNVFGVGTTTIAYNSVYLGADWRHFANLEHVFRGILDFFDANGSGIVPVELTDFRADQVGSRVELSWTTASEYNTSKFEVERSDVNEAGRSEFAKISELAAAGTSTVALNYGMSDYAVSMGNTYVYRLKTLDKDGQWALGPERTVVLTGLNGAISVEAITPNPVREGTDLHYNLTSEMPISIELYNTNGILVKVLESGVKGSGAHKLNIEASELTSGVYQVVLRSGDVMLNTPMNVIK